MKILMFGRGVIATTYGWVLAEAGHDVEFYVRAGRSATYGPTVELDLLDARRSIRARHVTTTWSPGYRERLEPDHDFDLIVVSVSHHRLAEAVAFLEPRAGTATILIFGNVWAEPLDVLGGLPRDQVAWGFPGAGGGFDESGVLRAGLLPTLVLGTLGEPPTARERAVRELFRGARFRPTEQTDMRGWLWIHFAMDAGIHAQGLALGTLSDLIGNRRALAEALRTSRELLAVLKARGIDLRRHLVTLLPVRMPAGMVAAAMVRLMGLVAVARRSLEAHTDATAEEPRAVCADALAEARRRGIAVPRLEAAVPQFAAKAP